MATLLGPLHYTLRPEELVYLIVDFLDLLVQFSLVSREVVDQFNDWRLTSQQPHVGLLSESGMSSHHEGQEPVSHGVEFVKQIYLHDQHWDS